MSSAFLSPLKLSHQGLLQQRFKAIPTFLSEYSFANLYLFRQAHDYHVLQDQGEVWIRGKTYDGRSFLMPTRDLREYDATQLSQMACDSPMIFPVDEAWLDIFKGISADISFQEGDSDYIYTTQAMATYQGPKMHGKKNLLNQFLSLYVPTAKPLVPGLMADAQDILKTWQQDIAQPPEETDYGACWEVLDRYEDLVLCGGIYYVQGEPAGFVIGEEFNQTMFTLHFAKGKRKFKGLYQYMFNHFAKMLPRQYVWLNLEQDLGQLALKIAKSSYHPAQMLRKYRVQIINKRD